MIISNMVNVDNMREWCKSHPRCTSCKFVANECVAPVSDSKFSEWLDNMRILIDREYK